MSKNKSIGLSVGVSSILVIFVLLCLTTFATLSLVSANTDYKLTRQSAGAVSEYYEADARAEEILAGITTELEALSQASSGPEYLARVTEELPAGIAGVESEVTAGGQAVLSYRVPIGEARELSVRLAVSAQPAPESGYVSRLEWKAQSLPDAAPLEDAISGLWSGEDSVLPLL